MHAALYTFACVCSVCGDVWKSQMCITAPLQNSTTARTQNYGSVQTYCQAHAHVRSPRVQTLIHTQHAVSSPIIQPIEDIVLNMLQSEIQSYTIRHPMLQRTCRSAFASHANPHRDIGLVHTIIPNAIVAFSELQVSNPFSQPMPGAWSTWVCIRPSGTKTVYVSFVEALLRWFMWKYRNLVGLSWYYATSAAWNFHKASMKIP